MCRTAPRPWRRRTNRRHAGAQTSAAAAVDGLMSETVAPLADELASRWKALFDDRGELRLPLGRGQPDRQRPRPTVRLVQRRRADQRPAPPAAPRPRRRHPGRLLLDRRAARAPRPLRQAARREPARPRPQQQRAAAGSRHDLRGTARSAARPAPPGRDPRRLRPAGPARLTGAMTGEVRHGKSLPAEKQPHDGACARSSARPRLAARADACSSRLSRAEPARHEQRRVIRGAVRHASACGERSRRTAAGRGCVHADRVCPERF